LIEQCTPDLARKPSKMGLDRLITTEWILGIALLAALTPAAAIINVAFAPICAAAALFMLLRQPTNYIKFTLWVWMLTPLVRRVVDYKTTWHESSFVMTAPLLVTAISGVAFFYRGSGKDRNGDVPYFVFIGVVLIGFFIGAVNAGIVAGLFDLLNWTLPAIFAIYVARAPLPAKHIAKTIFTALTWGALIIGAYGAYQYFFLPSWDAAWMITSKLGSIGVPVPREVRVFGPLNSPGPYALYMSAGILALMNSGSRVKWFAAAPAAIGLILSLVRSAWGGCIVGVLLIIAWSPVRKKVRYLMMMGAATIFVAPVVAFSPIGETLANRFESINSLGEDNSFLARQQLYSDYTSNMLSKVGGVGLAHSGIAGQISDDSSSAVSIDSGLLEIFFVFGIAGVFMLAAIAAIVVRSVPDIRSPEAIVAWSIAASGLSCLLFGNSLVGSQGMLVLPFFALAKRCKMALTNEPRLLARTKHAAQYPVRVSN
jgi:hypothetical protein